MDPNIYVGIGGFAGAVSITSFVLLAAQLLRIPIQANKALLASTASVAGTSLLVLILQKTAVSWSTEAWLSQQAKTILLGIVLPLAICSLLLGICLVMAGQLEAAPAFAVSLFAVGATILVGVSGLYGNPETRRVFQTLPGAALVTYVISGIGVAISLLGYALGAAVSPTPSHALESGRIRLWTIFLKKRTDDMKPKNPEDHVTIPPPPGGNYHSSDNDRPTVVGTSKGQIAVSAWLSVLAGPMKGCRFDLNQSEMKIGRNERCPIHISGDDEVGREHALIRYINGRHMLHDLAAINRTYLNENPVTDARQLMSGDRIRVGRTVIEFIEAGR